MDVEVQNLRLDGFDFGVFRGYSLLLRRVRELKSESRDVVVRPLHQAWAQ